MKDLEGFPRLRPPDDRRRILPHPVTLVRKEVKEPTDVGKGHEVILNGGDDSLQTVAFPKKGVVTGRTDKGDQLFGKDLRFVPPYISPIQPQKFLLVEYGAPPPRSVQGKEPAELMGRANLLDAAERAAQKGQVIEENLRQDAPPAELPDGNGAMPLAQLGMIMSRDQCVV